MKRFAYILIIIFIFSGCSVAPKKIEYGKDACHFCNMTIVEKTHAAEYVTSKGRAYKFDAIECLVNDLKGKNAEEMAFILVTDFANPTVLMNAKEATYLISEEIKSPMGANLSAFKNKNSINYKGKLYDWKTLNEHMKK